MDQAPYPGYDNTGRYYTPRKAPRVRPEAAEFASKNAGSINLFIDEKHRHKLGPLPSPRCLSYEAKQNYEKNRNGQIYELLGGELKTSELDAAPVARIKPEAQKIADYHKGGNICQLITNDFRQPESARRVPRVKIEASENAEKDRGQRMNWLLHDPKGLPSTPRPIPRVKSPAADTAQLGSGSQMAKVLFEYGTTPRSSRPVPRVKAEASENATLDQGKRMENLFISYGRQPQSARPVPRVRDGRDIAEKDKGGQLSLVMHGGDNPPQPVKPPIRAASALGRLITKKGKQSSISQLFSETSKWHLVPKPGMRSAKA